MEWDDKIEMARLMNNGLYKEVVEFIKDKPMDPQAMDMFLTGFDLSYMDLIKPIKDLFLNCDSGSFSFRSALRLELIKEHFKKE